MSSDPDILSKLAAGDGQGRFFSLQPPSAAGFLHIQWRCKETHVLCLEFKPKSAFSVSLFQLGWGQAPLVWPNQGSLAQVSSSSFILHFHFISAVPAVWSYHQVCSFHTFIGQIFLEGWIYKMFFFSPLAYLDTSLFYFFPIAGSWHEQLATSFRLCSINKDN